MLVSRQHGSPSDLYSEALFALRYGQLDDLMDKVRQLPSVSVVDADQENLLHKCARLCSAQGTRLLLKWKYSRPDINGQNIRGETPLHLALESLHSEDATFAREAAKIVLELIDAGAKLFLYDERGNTPFGIVGQMPNCPGKVVLKVHDRVEAEYGSAIGFMVDFGWHISASFHLQNTEVTKHMLKWCANQLRPGRDGKKPNELLHLALEAGCPFNMLTMLAYLGCLDVNASFNGRTPLHVAAEKNVGSSYYQHIDFLLIYGANPKTLDNRGMKPVQYIVQRNSPEVFKRLIAAESVVPGNAVSLRSPQCIHFAAANGCISTMQFLLTPSNIDSKCSLGMTPLHYAARKRKARAVYYLLAAGADVDAVDNMGWSALHHVVHGEEDKRQSDLVPVIGLLLHFGANVDHLGLNSETALSIALWRSKHSAVYQLIRHIALHRYSPEQAARQTMIESNDSLFNMYKKCLKELENLSKEDMAKGTNYLSMLRYTRKELMLVACGAIKVNYMNSPAAFPIYGNFLASRIHHANLELITFEEIGEVKDFHFRLDSLALSVDEFIRFFREKYLI